jgi:GAF domain-containing protein
MGDRFQHLFDSLADEVVVLDRDLRITYANPAWLRRVGLLSPQVQGQTCYQVLLGAAAPCAAEVCSVQQAFRTGQPHRGACEAYDQLIDAQTLSTTASPVLDEQGIVSEVVLSLSLPMTEFLQDNAQTPTMFQRKRRQQRSVDAFRETLLVTKSGQGLQAILDAILDQLRRIVDYDCASIMRTGDTEARIIAGRGFAPDKQLDELKIPLTTEKIVWIQQAQQPMVIHDVQLDPEWIPIPGTEHIRSWIGAPLLGQERLIGFLTLGKSEPGHYQPEDTELVTAFANQTAIVIENAQSHQKSEHYAGEVAERAERLALVNRISMAVSSTLDLDQILRTAVREMAQVFGVRQSGIILFDEQTEYGRVAAEYQESPDGTAQVVRIPLTNNPSLEQVIATRQPLAITDAQSDPLAASIREVVETRNIESILIVPLITKGEVIGTIGLDAINKPRVFTPEEIDLAQTIANQIATAVENARLFSAEAHRRREAETLQKATLALSTTLDLQEIFGVILSELQQVVPYDSASVQQVKGDRLELIGGHGFPNLEELLGIGFELAGTDNPNQEVMRTQAPVILDDAPARYEKFRREPHSQAGIRSWMGVPLLFGDKSIGMIALDKQEPGFYTKEHARLAMAFAAQAAIAIENSRLYKETQQQLRDLEVLFVTSAALSTSLDMDRVLHITAEQITQALSSEGCAISIWDRDRDTLTTLLDYSVAPEWWDGVAPGTTYPLSEYPATRNVLTSRQPLAIRASDASADVAERTWMRKEHVRSLLLVPMIVRDEVFGLLELMEGEIERAFTATEIHLCQTLANQAAAALDNARLFQEVETRAREMEALASVGVATTTLDLDKVLDTIAENALQAVQAEISSVYLLDRDRKQLSPWSVRGRHQVELERADFALGEGTIGQVAQSGAALIVDDVTADSVFVAKSNAARWINNTLTVPLTVKGNVIGTLEVCNKVGGGRFTESDQRLLSAFAAQAGIVIENARLYHEVSLHLEEVLLLNQVALAATATLNFDQVVHHGLAALLGTRNFERVNMLLVDEAKGDLWLHPAFVGSDLFPQRADFRIPLEEGITGHVVQTGKPLRVADVRQDDRYLAGYPDTLSELCVPLRAGDRIIGVLDVQSTQLNAFSDNDERLLTTLASQLSTVLDNARLFEETQQRVRDLTALTQVSLALNEAKDLNTVLDIVLEQALTLLGSREGSIILIDPPEGDRLRIVAERGLGAEIAEAFNRRPVYKHEGTYRRALQSGRIVEVSETASDPDFLHDVGSQATEVTNVPLVTEDGALGVIAAEGLPPDDTARQLLSALADMAAVAIEKERLHQETTTRLSEVSTLYTLSAQITSSLSLSTVLESIVTILKLTLDCRACSIFLIDATREYLVLEAASSQAQEWEGVARMRIGEGVSGKVIAERRSIYVPDTHAESDFLFFGRDIRSLLVVPLIVRDKAIGTLSIDDFKPNAFHDEVRLLTIAAAQAAVAIENARLHESLQNSYVELEKSYNELRQLDKMKSEFVQNISHELRTPLTFIKGYVELLRDGEMGKLDAEQLGALDIVAKKAEALSRLVDDIISLQQAERRRRQFASFSLSELGHEAVRSAQASAMDLGITLCDEIPDNLPHVFGDRARLGQVFDNLLQNALKFSDAGGSITVRMREQGVFICTEVEDTGIGIPPEKMSRIFDRFYQVDGTPTRRFGGTGLGLAIVKQIVETHGGQVDVESKVGEGSLFSFTIPQANPKSLSQNSLKISVSEKEEPSSGTPSTLEGRSSFGNGS